MPLTIDTLLYSIYTTLLNPLLCTILTLSLAARSPTWSFAPLHAALVYTALVFALRILLALDSRGYFLSGDQQTTPRTLDWPREVVLVTGGCGGLGGLIAELYALRGVRVAVVDVLPETPERVEEWEAKGGAYFRCDVGDADAVAALRSRVEVALGPPTVLISAAATIAPGPLAHTSPATIARAYATNLHAHAYALSTFLPGMLAAPGGGTVVTVASVLGQLGGAGIGLYASAKAGLVALHWSLTAELPLMAVAASGAASAGGGENGGARRIRTVLVRPGQLTTPLFAEVVPPSSFFGPVVEVQELARLVVEKVDAGTGGEVAVPLYARWIAWFQVLPPGLRGLVRAWSGLDRGAWDGLVRRRKDEGKTK